MKKLIIILVCFSLAPAYAAPKAQSPKYHPENLSLMTGDEILTAPAVYSSYPLPRGLDEVDVIGDTLTIGTTWYDNQHNGTIGRMLDIGDDGWVQFGWMKGYNSAQDPRHIWWNAYDPATSSLAYTAGAAVDYLDRGGFVVVDVAYGGIAFPCFHQGYDPFGNFHTAAAFDIAPHLGGFTAFDILPYLYDPYGNTIEIIWPRMQFAGDESVMHIVSTENPASGVAGDPQRMFYTPGTFDPLNYTINFPQPPDSSFRMMQWTMTIAPDVATSEVSDRIAFAWTYCRDEGFPQQGGSYSQLNNDIHILIDEDGLDPDFTQAFNLTNFIPPDLSYLPDTTLADMDTLRAYTDLNLFFDQDDWLHAAFTTRAYFELEQTTYWNTSIVWHWTEQYPDEFKVVHNAFDDWWPSYAMFNNVYCGAWNLKAQRPELGQDPTTGNLYCMYQVFDTDTSHLSWFIDPEGPGWGQPSGEVYVSVSTDGGMNWSVGTNVTNTRTPDNAPPGQSKSELTPSLAKLVNGTCHFEYVYDLDAGNISQGEGVATNSPVKYHRVPVSLIPTTPLVPQWPVLGGIPFHVEHGVVPDVSITLTPYGGSIVIPGGGGAFNYNIEGTNNTLSPQNVDVWCMVTLPNGTQYGPTLGPFNTTLAGGASMDRDRTQWVPAGAPAGNYTYHGYVGVYPGTIMDQDSFPFTKLPGDGGVGIGEWANDGEAFPDEAANVQPADYVLHPCAPNPFNPTAVLRYDLREASRVSLEVYNTAGKLVQTLANGWREAGSHQVSFDGTDLASGIYVYRLQAGSFAASGKMVLMK